MGFLSGLQSSCDECSVIVVLVVGVVVENERSSESGCRFGLATLGWRAANNIRQLCEAAEKSRQRRGVTRRRYIVRRVRGEE